MGAALLSLCACEMFPRKPVEVSSKSTAKEAANQVAYFDASKGQAQQKINEMKTGSLWVNSYSSRLYENMYRASKVGDTLIVIVSENSKAKGSGNTSTEKTVDQSNTISSLGGLFTKLQTLASVFNPTNLIKGNTASKFDGKGSTERSGELSATLSVVVTEVLPNGNMVVRGEKHIKMNKEDQLLIVEGVIRPYDISPDNTIQSMYLADARVTYSGLGVVADRQSPGWLVRVLDKIWPF